MLKQIEINNLSLEGPEKELVTEGIGKILKIYVELEESINLKIITKEDELVLDVVDSGTYYPRANILSKKDMGDTLIGETQEHDYFYFEGLLLEVSSPGIFEGMAIKKLRIFYDDMNGI